MPSANVFGPETTKKLLKLANESAQKNKGRTVVVREPPMPGIFQTLQIGITDDAISAGSSGVVSVYQSGIDTTEDITAEVPSELTSEAVSAGKGVIAGWFQSEETWKIIAAECEDADPPDVVDVGNTNEPQTVTEEFSSVAGMTETYSSGSAMALIPLNE